MNAEGIKFIDGVFDNLILSASSCNCEVRSDDFKDIVTETVVVIIVKPPGA